MTKADKINATVIVDEKTYNTKMSQTFSDPNNYNKLSEDSITTAR